MEVVSGRKHPSAIQTKQLKHRLPSISAIHFLISSQVFRAKVVCPNFIKNVGCLLRHVKSIDCGTTKIVTAVGQQGSDQFILTTFKLTEILVSHPSIISSFYLQFIDHLVPHLVELVGASCGDNQAFSLRLLSEITGVLMNNSYFDTIKYKNDLDRIYNMVENDLFPVCVDIKYVFSFS